MRSLHKLLFPPTQRQLPAARAWNIAARTAHIAFTGILLGGHVFDVAEDRLRIVFALVIVTGVLLVGIEAYPSCQWFYLGSGAMTIVKLLLLCTIPFFWEQRVPILLVIVVIASVGAHMPGRFRYYSLVHRRVMHGPASGPAS